MGSISIVFFYVILIGDKSQTGEQSAMLSLFPCLPCSLCRGTISMLIGNSINVYTQAGLKKKKTLTGVILVVSFSKHTRKLFSGGIMDDDFDRRMELRRQRREQMKLDANMWVFFRLVDKG